ncbi:MAG TPA: CCA tRNA nucleotidyltransferase [Nitrososphaeraceae archaeon]|nr:CCA tRNA nucleotidyltransferase [Nitrososphaeraceae archaeon]
MIDTIISKALQDCQPSNREIKKLMTIADETKKLVVNHISSKVVDVVFGGSYAKGTWLKSDADIDIFIKIDPSLNTNEFEKLGKQIGLQSLKRYRPYLRYSDHPFVEAFVKGVRVNIVPCYNVEKGKWKSAADRSPFHTEYVKNNLDDEKRKQVRLLKKFLKCIGVYGAEIATNGLSGYIAEVLILKYGSFELVLKAISNISKEKNVISINKADEDIVRTFQSYIIIIDPIDPRRNLGAAVSAESIGKFILAARAFLEKPSLRFFKKTEKKDKKSSKQLFSNLLIVEFTYEQRSPDVIWGQLKKSLNAISKQLKLANFTVIRSRCITDEKNSAAFIFLLESIMLPPYVEKVGPEIFRKDTSNFISKNSKRALLMWVNKEMRVSSLVQRKATSAKDYIKFLLTQQIRSTGITKGLIKDIQGVLQIYTGDERKIRGVIKNAIDEIVTTEHTIFQ